MKTPAPTLPATLELEGPVRLAGELCLLADGRLQLSSTRVLDDAGRTGKFSMPARKAAILNMGALRDREGFIDNLDVTVCAASGTTLILAFLNSKGDLERRCLSLLPGHEEDGETAENTARPLDDDSDILPTLQLQSIEQLDKLLVKFLDDLCSHLLTLSAKTKQFTSGEDGHYGAMNAISKNRRAINTQVTETVAEYYKDLTPNKTNTQKNTGSQQQEESLDLLDLKEFEDNLAVARMIGNGENLYGISLECLTLRLADIADCDPHTLRLPVHVAQLCRVFQQAIVACDIPDKAIPDIFDFMGRQFIRRLEDYYNSLNALLRTHGIRADLEHEIRAKGSILQRPGPYRKSPERKRTPAEIKAEKSDQERKATEKVAELAEELLGQIHTKPAPDKLYQSVIEALNFKREADGILATAASGLPATEASNVNSANQGELADSGSIAKILGQMQQDASLRTAVQESASLREYLAQNQAEISGLKDSGGLSPDSLNQLDLVDNMFGSIKSHMDVTADLKPALGNLQIPLARLALQEPQFFMDRSHAARGVMDKLALLTSSANFPNKALEGRIQNIIDSIVVDYDSDSAVFDSALAQVEKLVAQQERALTRNVERVVLTQEGNEKLKRAQRAVSDELGSRIAPPAAPEVLINLVDSGWRDLLILTHVKEGPESETWDEHLKTLDLLTRWLNEQHEGALDEELLTQRGMEAGSIIDMVDQQISAALPTSVAHEPVLDNLRDILAGREPIIVREVAVPESLAEPADVRAKIENLPRLRRWIRRVEELEKGTWLTYKDKSGKKRRMQLAWISDAKDRYIFVNERGQKNADLTAVQLARQLGRGVQPPPPSDKLSLVDRSMFDTLEHVQKSLSFTKNHDSLTKLINRETFVDQMSRAFRHAQRKHSQHAVLYLNIDKFELVNEVYDRINGDQVLTEFAGLLAQLHGRKSSSARLQGDEFAVLLLDRDPEQAVRYAEKIRSDIEASHVDIDNEKVTFTVSIGVAPLVDYSPGVEETLESAQTAMRQAKDQGRNRVVLFEEDENQAQTYQNAQDEAKANIEQTIETDRFVLRAQPIVQTLVESGSPASEHYELLLTLSEPDGSLISPQEFIDNAERFGYMTEVDRWVIKEAFKWISQLIDNQKVVPNISINLSGASVTDDSFMEYLLEQISEFGVGTNRLCFEITETGTISNLIKAADFVRTFRNIGCKFSIDDFGTGLASHNYLRELPVDYVKIDGTFITGISENRNDYAMARSINDLAHFLGQETIAESVENESIINSLREIGVDYLQGWGIAKPRLLSEVSKDLKSIEK
ncbi:MAG: DUF1631 family protein [Halioglobus sp.]